MINEIFIDPSTEQCGTVSSTVLNNQIILSKLRTNKFDPKVNVYSFLVSRNIRIHVGPSTFLSMQIFVGLSTFMMISAVISDLLAIAVQNKRNTLLLLSFCFSFFSDSLPKPLYLQLVRIANGCILSLSWRRRRWLVCFFSFHTARTVQPAVWRSAVCRSRLVLSADRG